MSIMLKGLEMEIIETANSIIVEVSSNKDCHSEKFRYPKTKFDNQSLFYEQAAVDYHKLPLKQFIVFWERIANSGIHLILAHSPESAIAKSGYNTQYCKLTVCEYVGDPYIVGNCN